MRVATCFACLLVVVSTAGAEVLPRAATEYGSVEGEMENGVKVFRGIPYGQAPSGERRFKPAGPPQTWSQLRPAVDFMPACPQIVDIDPTENNNSVMGEDCLGINVWTPNTGQGKRPVMVFIHGGAYVAGSARNSWYDGAHLAARGGVVVVTMQYRLGVLGFLELADIAGKDYAMSGNLGTLDQIEALRWVQRNIAAFGGDPSNVTLFGESVGATSVAILMGLPQAHGLFAKAILESNSAARVGHDKARATLMARDFMKAARAKTVGELQALTMPEIRAVQARYFDEVFGDSSFGPTWGDGVMTEPPMKRLLDGRGVSIPVLIGTNLDEIRFWSAIEDLPLERKSEDLLRKQLIAIVGERAQKIIDTYRGADSNFADAIIHLETDLLFRMTSVRMAEALSTRQSTFMYLFTYRSTSTFANYGSAHSLEIPFVFGVLDDLDVIAFTGRDSHRRTLADQMQDAWLQFAKTGNPSHSGLPSWPRYDVSSRATMELGVDSHLSNDPLSGQRRAWDGVPFDNLKPSGLQVSAFLSENGS